MHKVLMISLVIVLLLFLISCSEKQPLVPSEDQPPAQSVEEKQPAGQGCCAPACGMLTQVECSMHGGEWYPSSCSEVEECQKGCCILSGTQMTKVECDQSVGEDGHWEKGECPKWEIKETLINNALPQFFPEMGSGDPTTSGKRIITVEGHPLRKAAKGEQYDYQTEWEVTIKEDYEFTTVTDLRTVSPLYPSYKECVGRELTCSWIKKPSFSTQVKLKFNLDSSHLDTYTASEGSAVFSKMGATKMGDAFASEIIQEGCDFKSGLYTCTLTGPENCLGTGSTSSSTEKQGVLGDVCTPYGPVTPRENCVVDLKTDSYFHYLWKKQQFYGYPDIILHDMSEDGAKVRFIGLYDAGYWGADILSPELYINIKRRE